MSQWRSMLFGHLLTNPRRFLPDSAHYWSPESGEARSGHTLDGAAANGICTSSTPARPRSMAPASNRSTASPR